MVLFLFNVQECVKFIGVLQSFTGESMKITGTFKRTDCSLNDPGDFEIDFNPFSSPYLEHLPEVCNAVSSKLW